MKSIITSDVEDGVSHFSQKACNPTGETVTSISAKQCDRGYESTSV